MSKPTRPNLYPYIRKWGEMMGSNEDYILRQISDAIADNAPVNAIYYSRQEGKWSTTDDLKNLSIRKEWGLDK